MFLFFKGENLHIETTFASESQATPQVLLARCVASRHRHIHLQFLADQIELLGAAQHMAHVHGLVDFVLLAEARTR